MSSAPSTPDSSSSALRVLGTYLLPMWPRVLLLLALLIGSVLLTLMLAATDCPFYRHRHRCPGPQRRPGSAGRRGAGRADPPGAGIHRRGDYRASVLRRGHLPRRGDRLERHQPPAQRSGRACAEPGFALSQGAHPRRDDRAHRRRRDGPEQLLLAVRGAGLRRGALADRQRGDVLPRGCSAGCGRAGLRDPDPLRHEQRAPARHSTHPPRARGQRPDVRLYRGAAVGPGRCALAGRGQAYPRQVSGRAAHLFLAS